MNLLPIDVLDTDPVAMQSVAWGATVHRPGDYVTPCAIPMWAMKRPALTAKEVAGVRRVWCLTCFPAPMKLVNPSTPQPVTPTARYAIEPVAAGTHRRPSSVFAALRSAAAFLSRTVVPVPPGDVVAVAAGRILAAVGDIPVNPAYQSRRFGVQLPDEPRRAA